MSFHTLGLSKPLLDALAAKDYSQATPIQLQAIPTVLTGRDLLGIAQTGTGKTAAFMLPSLQRLAAANRVPHPGSARMLVLAPTRELASQIAASAQTYGRFMHLSVGVIFGGVPNSKSLRTVARGIDVPGVSHVINFDLPDVPEQYVHRIGRTARAGADGIAVAFCSHEERGNLRDTERTTRQKITVAPLPADFAANAEAFKRLKPAPKASENRGGYATKGARRSDGQRRQNRNDGQQRHPQRSDGHAAHRPEGGHGKRPFRGRRRRTGAPAPPDAGKPERRLC